MALESPKRLDDSVKLRWVYETIVKDTGMGRSYKHSSLEIHHAYREVLFRIPTLTEIGVYNVRTFNFTLYTIVNSNLCCVWFEILSVHLAKNNCSRWGVPIVQCL